MRKRIQEKVLSSPNYNQIKSYKQPSNQNGKGKNFKKILTFEAFEASDLGSTFFTCSIFYHFGFLWVHFHLTQIPFKSLKNKQLKSKKVSTRSDKKI